jgi:hypothetical protein
VPKYYWGLGFVELVIIKVVAVPFIELVGIGQVVEVLVVS